MNSYITTTPLYNNSLISMVRLRDPSASHRGNPALNAEILAPAPIIHFGDVGWDRGGEWVCSLAPRNLF